MEATGGRHRAAGSHFISRLRRTDVKSVWKGPLGCKGTSSFISISRISYLRISWVNKLMSLRVSINYFESVKLVS